MKKKSNNTLSNAIITVLKSTQFIAIILCIAISVSASAQKTFVRVYNLQGKIISKGNLLPGTDSTVELGRGDSAFLIVPVNTVGIIETKHTAGHSIFWGALIGSTSGAFLGGVGSGGADNNGGSSYGGGTNDGFGLSYNTGDAIGGGALIGGVLGGVTGTIIGVTKKRQKYTINGDTDKWKKLRNKLVWAE